MAWYPGAQRMELQPESDAQPTIRPTQFIVHSIVAPWSPRRTYEYWRDSTNLESHFGLGYDGDLAQYIGTETRADANAAANRRPDGTGAVSIETASNTAASDPWTAQQVEQLIRLGVWLHQQHKLPLRICRTHDDPGYGYHRLHSQWAVSGTACPGDARVRQFREVVFPGIVARATGQTSTAPKEDDMAAVDVWAYKNTKIETRDAYEILRSTNRTVEALRQQVTAQTAAIQAIAAQLGDDVDTDTVVAAVQQAIRDAVIRVDVDITGTQEA
ncbi:N-acetylmuramoyl-L-alanine amidase [Streptomyces fradiae ATCC 10745 = DSM 40063]|uniref:N-acetylmuramoyl-L-alanine amidase n=3 Tax=Streptomyces TaxID=1883 RepID=A0A1Y2NSV7_STRFR|nr:N-acetylmuramoyl-L-alanine amidase [Streptomyces fradiae ATCC 10745 = DSM 40063]QEV11612.1 N-acetylmuramoyl-L-alanine amidase [Streptomyces fradiae ATCC 10745 = DSM 40063]